MNYVDTGPEIRSQEEPFTYLGYGGDLMPSPELTPSTWRAQETWWRHEEPQETWWRHKACIPVACCCLLVLTFLAFFPLLASMLLTSISPDPQGFDCNADRSAWRYTWSDEKSAYCCETLGLACGDFANVVSTTHPRIASLSTSSPSQTTQLAPTTLSTSTAPSPPTRPPDPWNCATDYEAWESLWSEDKKGWCCRVHHRGCPPTSPQTRPPTAMPPVVPETLKTTPPPALPAPVVLSFDCAAGYANWIAGWSLPKKEWCCQHGGKGCEKGMPGYSSTPALFDCVAGFAQGGSSWSVGKKVWCCWHTGKGCNSGGVGQQQ